MEELGEATTRCPVSGSGSPTARLGARPRRPTYEEVAAQRPSREEVVEFVNEELEMDDLPGFYRAVSADRTVVDDHNDRRLSYEEVVAGPPPAVETRQVRRLPQDVLKDTRQKAWPRASLRHTAVNEQALKQPLPIAAVRSQKSHREKRVASSSCCAPLWLCLAWLRRGACLAAPKMKDLSEYKELDAPRKWYRIHPITDLQYFVRPDAGKRGRIPGLKEPEPTTPTARGRPLAREDERSTQTVRTQARDGRLGLTKSYSMPSFLDKRLGISDPTISGADSFQNLCRICYALPTQIITLPCRHGGMCENCCRRTLLGRPAHKGGRACPFCRKTIREVIRIYEDAVIPQYGYALDVL